jgi:hypothetical protein
MSQSRIPECLSALPKGAMRHMCQLMPGCLRADVQARLRPLKVESVHELQADAARERHALASTHKDITRMLSKLYSAGA